MVGGGCCYVVWWCTGVVVLGGGIVVKTVLIDRVVGGGDARGGGISGGGSRLFVSLYGLVADRPDEAVGKGPCALERRACVGDDVYVQRLRVFLSQRAV
mmetsp:Transcript_22953/g.31411  ORF Transcript_22953/g.31411 Transcript_22953/m.31411 type:complete len:99 (+) Transcript_22953:463-759(+)